MTSVRSGHTATLLRERARADRAAASTTRRRCGRPSSMTRRPGASRGGIAERATRRRHGDAAARRPRARRGAATTAAAASRAPSSTTRQTGRFARTGAMRAARAAHTATRLRDGRVLVTGGSDLRRSRVALRRDLRPADSGRFSATGSLTIRRHKHAAALLARRPGARPRRLGRARLGWPLPRAELFNPRNGRFSRTARRRRPRFKLPDAVAVMPSGAVLVAGGAQVVDRFRSGRFAPVARLDAATVQLDGDAAPRRHAARRRRLRPIDHAHRAQLPLPALNHDVNLAGAVHAHGEQLLDVGAAARPGHDRERARQVVADRGEELLQTRRG